MNKKKVFLLIVCHVAMGIHLQAQEYKHALEFDGIDGSVQLSEVLKIGQSSNTVEMWVKVPEAGTGGLGANDRVGVLLGNFNSTPNANWEIHNQGDMRLYWNGGEPDIRGTTDLRDNTWHHLAFVRDTDNNKFVFYIDGEVELEHIEAGDDIDFSPHLHRLGGDNRPSVDVPHFHGKMDEVRIWNIARTQAELREHMYVELNGDEPGLVAYYKMLPGSGTTLDDDTTDGTNTGTLEDGVDWVDDFRIPAGVSTSTEPFEIAALENLFWLSQHVNLIHWNKSFIQVADIDATATQYWEDGKGFYPIGIDVGTTVQFHYDGQGHIIDNLFIDRSENGVGFVNYTNGATIENLGLENATVRGNNYVGILVGTTTNNSLVIQCYTTGSVTGLQSAPGYIGGLVGSQLSSTVSNSYSTASVEAISNAGGLVGLNDNSEIHNSYSTGSVTITGSNKGGLVGKNENTGTIINSFWDKESSGVSEGVGDGSDAGVSGKTTAEMQHVSTFIQAGWEFSAGAANHWATNLSDNQGYIFFRYQDYTPAHIWFGTDNGNWATAANWSEGGVPGETHMVIIPHLVAKSQMPVIAPNQEVDVDALIVEPDASLTIQSDATGTGSLIIGSSHINDGNITSQRYFPQAEVAWHMLAAPVSGGIAASGFDPLDGTEDFYAWQETAPGTWVNYAVTEGDPNFPDVNSGTDFVPGRGYLVAYAGENPTKAFTGTLNTGELSIQLKNSASKSWTYETGWNLLGNPYSSGIDWNQADRSSFQDDFAYAYNPNKGGGAGYEEIDGSAPGADALIGPHQAFFVLATQEAHNDNFTFTPGMQVHGGQFYKDNKQTDHRLVVRLQAGSYYDETTVRLRQGASFDRDRQDALKLMSFSAHVPQIYTQTSDQVQVAVNSIPGIDREEPVVIGMRIPAHGQHVISLREMGGVFADSPLVLEDTRKDLFHDWQAHPEYFFEAEEGEDTQRFVLHFEASGDGVTHIESLAEPGLFAWYNQNTLFVHHAFESAELTLFDISGRLMGRFLAGPGESRFHMSQLPVGVYVIQANMPNHTETRQIFVVH